MIKRNGVGDSPKILNFPVGGKFFPTTARICALYFYGPPLKLPGATETISPCAMHAFQTPATEAEAADFIAGLARDGGYTGEYQGNYLYIPWPCVVYFELIKP